MRMIENPVDLSNTPLASVQGYLNLLLARYRGRKMVFLHEHPVNGQPITRPDDLKNTIVLSWHRISPKHQIGRSFSHGTVFAGHWIDFNMMPESLSDLPDDLEFSERSTQHWKTLIYATNIYNIMTNQKRRLEEKIGRTREEIQRLQWKMRDLVQEIHRDRSQIENILPSRDAVRVSAIRQFRELANLVPGTYLKIDFSGEGITAQTSNIYLEDEDGYGYDLGALEVYVPFDTENEMTVKSTNSSVYSRGGYFHPHVNTNGSVCWGEGYDLVYNLQLQGEYAQLLIYIEQFLRSYNPDGPYEKLRYWNEDYEVCPWCEYEGNPDNWHSLCDSCYENSWWCAWCDEERISEGRYCNYCLDAYEICPHCDEYLVESEKTLCPSCREVYGCCDECGEVIDRDELDEDDLCPDCCEFEEDESETGVETMEREAA